MEDIEYSRDFAQKTLSLMSLIPPQLAVLTDEHLNNYSQKYHYFAVDTNTYVFEYEVSYSNIDPAEIQLKNSAYYMESRIDPLKSLAGLIHTTSLHKSDIEERYGDTKLQEKLNKTKKQLDAYSLAIQLPIDEKYQVIASAPINYSRDGVRTMLPVYMGFFILHNEKSTRYFQTSYGSPVVEYDKNNFYARLSTSPKLDELKTSFMVQEEKLVLSTQIAPSQKNTPAQTFRI